MPNYSFKELAYPLCHPACPTPVRVPHLLLDTEEGKSNNEWAIIEFKIPKIKYQKPNKSQIQKFNDAKIAPRM